MMELVIESVIIAFVIGGILAVIALQLKSSAVWDKREDESMLKPVPITDDTHRQRRRR